jgi:hypothetical protein
MLHAIFSCGGGAPGASECFLPARKHGWMSASFATRKNKGIGACMLAISSHANALGANCKKKLVERCATKPRADSHVKNRARETMKVDRRNVQFFTSVQCKCGRMQRAVL